MIFEFVSQNVKFPLHAYNAFLIRLVPFIAVCSANSVNLPMMRRLELTDGIELTTEDGEFIGKSKTAAKQGISMVVLSRIGMVCQKKFNLDIAIPHSPYSYFQAAPGMVGIPLIMNYLDKKGTLTKYPRITLPLQVKNEYEIPIK